MVRKKYKSPLVCPYGAYMNELATPSMCGHINIEYWKYTYLHRLNVKPHRNIRLQVRWDNRFRKYRRVLC